jgi:hypothetical protein
LPHLSRQPTQPHRPSPLQSAGSQAHRSTGGSAVEPSNRHGPAVGRSPLQQRLTALQPDLQPSFADSPSGTPDGEASSLACQRDDEDRWFGAEESREPLP